MDYMIVCSSFFGDKFYKQVDNLNSPFSRENIRVYVGKEIKVTSEENFEYLGLHYTHKLSALKLVHVCVLNGDN